MVIIILINGYIYIYIFGKFYQQLMGIQWECVNKYQHDVNQHVECGD